MCGPTPWFKGPLRLRSVMKLVLSVSKTPSLLPKSDWLIFTFEETDQTVTSTNRSAILGFTSTRRQDYQRALYLLFQNYGGFLQTHPGEATAALIRVFRSLFRRDLEIDIAQVLNVFVWNDVECRIDNYKPSVCTRNRCPKTILPEY